MGLGSVLLLLAGGFFAGVVNTLAGAGSMINIPLLAWTGLPHTVANATNRVAVIVQSVTATTRYHRTGHMPWGLTRHLLIPIVIGALGGSLLATVVSDRIFRPIVGVELLILAGLLLFKPDIWINPTPKEHQSLNMWRIRAEFLLIGVYAGFLQAGVGFLMIASLVRHMGTDLVRGNAAKMILTFFATLVSLVIFLSADLISWVPGLVLAVGNGIGGWVGAHMAVTRGARWIRWSLVVTVSIAALQILGVFEFLGRMTGLTA